MTVNPLGTSPIAQSEGTLVAQGPEKKVPPEAPSKSQPKVPGGVTRQQPPATDTWSYIGIDVTDRKSHEVTPIQLAVHQRGDTYIVKNAAGRTYDITAELQAQPQRYLKADGSVDPNTLRELLQVKVSAGAMSVSAGDLRKDGVTTSLVTGIPLRRDEGGPQATAEIDRTNKDINDFNRNVLGGFLEVGAIAFGVGELSAAIRTYKSLSAAQVAAKAAGEALSAADTKLLKTAEITLTSYGVGAMAGGTSYALFIDQKHWDEAYSAMAAGQPLESLSLGAKAAVTLMNWTIVPGSISNSLARTNVKIGMKAAIDTLGQGKLNGFNWGMFIDPKAWTPANITRVMGPTTSTPQMIGARMGELIVKRSEPALAKYASVLDELGTLRDAGQSLVTSKGMPRVSESVLRQAGFDSPLALHNSLIRDGLYKGVVSPSERVLGTYAPVFDELAALREAGQPLVTDKGMLRVSEQALRAAGFDDLPALAEAMTRDGLWRVFTFKPVLNSPFGFAVHNSPGATANATFQLAASRAATGVAANLALQSLSDFGFNGSVDINWDQAIAAAAGGGPRGLGAPGAWVGKFSDRLISYGSSSAAGFLTQWMTKDILAARNKEAETYTSEQLSAIGNANQALNGAAMLLDAYAKAGKPPPAELFNSTQGQVGLGEDYVARLVDLLSVSDVEQIGEQAKRLDEWLDTPISANGLTRRERLSLVSMPEPLADTMVGSNRLRELYKTGTMQDLGFAPRFSERVAPDK